MDENATGKLLGHILLAIVRFVCGAAVGLLLWMRLVVYVDYGWWFLVACVLGSGLLAVVLGEVFFKKTVGSLDGD